MDISKEFDILNHDLLIAKLEVYGFSAKSLSGIRNYLNKRLQKTNGNCDFSLWKEIFSEKCYCLPENVITWLLDEMPSDMNLSFKMAQFFLPSAKKHIVLGITIDSRLTFYSHLKQFCKKVANLNHNQRWLIYSLKAHSIVVSNLRSETKGSRFDPAASYVQRWASWCNWPTNVQASVKRLEVVVRS